MTGRWDRPGVPHRGWTLVDTIDLEEATHICEMCGQEQIRYVHVVAHAEHEDLEVGCICACWMTGDYTAPKRAVTRLKSLAQRKSRWLARRWRVSAAGNEFLNVGGRNVGVFPDRFRPGRWRWRIGGEFSADPFLSPAKAKSALFDALVRRGQLAART